MTYTVTAADLQGVAPNGQAFAIQRVSNPFVGDEIGILFQQPDGTWTLKEAPYVIDQNQLLALGAIVVVASAIGTINLAFKNLFTASAPAPAPAPSTPPGGNTAADVDALLKSGAFQITIGADGIPVMSQKP